MIVLNFKTYSQVTGKNAVDVLETIKELNEANPAMKEKVYVCPAQIDLTKVVMDFPQVNVMAQNIDVLESGSNTGWTSAECVRGLGVKYTLLNHSEHRVGDIEILKKFIESVQGIGIKVLVCCENLEEAEELLKSEPFGIAYEPKELIGSGRSVSSEEPEIVEEFIGLCEGKTKAFIGAGVSTKDDVKASYQLGAYGVLLASAFAKTDDKKAKLQEFVEGVV